MPLNPKIADLLRDSDTSVGPARRVPDLLGFLHPPEMWAICRGQPIRAASRIREDNIPRVIHQIWGQLRAEISRRTTGAAYRLAFRSIPPAPPPFSGTNS